MPKSGEMRATGSPEIWWQTLDIARSVFFTDAAGAIIPWGGDKPRQLQEIITISHTLMASPAGATKIVSHVSTSHRNRGRSRQAETPRVEIVTKGGSTMGRSVERWHAEAEKLGGLKVQGFDCAICGRGRVQAGKIEYRREDGEVDVEEDAVVIATSKAAGSQD